MSLLVDERDVRFVLFDQLRIQELTQFEPFREHTDEVFDMVLAEAHRLAETVLAPANVDGDRIGAQYLDGTVRLPPSFHACYRAACEGGWICPADSPTVGGQGLPASLATAAYEMFMAANMASTVYLTLNHGAGKLIEKHGTEAQRARYLAKLYSGEWGGTMCLTEPGAGSDLGALKTRARRNADGTFLIEGTKQFITAGEHDLTENIIYPVLARIEGDPPGSRGISLFLVSKYRIRPDGTLGERNDVVCSGIEHKMGIKGSSTCTLNFGDNGNCVAELLGAERQGLPIMFLMMNEERLMVGLQAQGIASSAYQHAVKFARERIQGARITEGKNPDAPAVPIIEHPDVRRMLMWMKAYVEGVRALLYYTAYCIDCEQTAAEQDAKRRWMGLVELLTPICKAYASDMGYDVCEQAIQVHGGYGYCAEYPVEQFARDCKITSIYEGTNGIQAQDLLGRKILRTNGQNVAWLLEEVRPVVKRAGKVPALGDMAAAVEDSLSRLQDAVNHLRSLISRGEMAEGFLEATPLLEIFGDVLLGWFWLWQAEIAYRCLEGMHPKAGADMDTAFLRGKLLTARYYVFRLLPFVQAKVAGLKAKVTSPLEMPDDGF